MYRTLLHKIPVYISHASGSVESSEVEGSSVWKYRYIRVDVSELGAFNVPTDFTENRVGIG